MGALVRAMLAAAVLFGAGQARAAFDPTAPPGFALPAGVDRSGVAELAWVRVDGRHSVAWYGGTTVRLGDIVDGGRLVAVHEDHIVIAGTEGRRIVYLLNPALRARQSKNSR